MRVLAAIALILVSNLALADNSPTLYNDSVNWDDVTGRVQLLAAANIPLWDQTAVNAVYKIYLNTQQRQTLVSQDEQKYNTAFLDEYWGPIANPFAKYARPAKVFIYINEKNYYMAPIIKSTSDGDYYIFNHESSHPQRLIDWVNNLKTKQGAKSIKFNVCNGYGNLPADTCAGSGYQYEENYALNSHSYHKNLRSDEVVKTLSAYRSPSQDWHIHYLAKAKSILNTSIEWDNVEKRNQLLLTTTAWPNYKTIKENFEKLRDIRYFADMKKDNFSRRISWLYPDDGCWTRASAVINHLFGAANNAVNQFVRPSKVFAFGNLCANTPNNKKGRVTWWYHTAPIVRDAETNQVYVLDPSINPQQPMTIESWMAAISSSAGACETAYAPRVEQFNICTGYGSSPGDVCNGGTANFVSEAEDALLQSYYQNYERDRQVELGRDADTVLGDQAPWM